MKLQISRKQLIEAATDVNISEQQADALWKRLTSQQPVTSENLFDLSHILYYFGAITVIVAMGWFFGTEWETFGGGGIFLVSLCYIVAFWFCGHLFWNKPALKTVGGLFITIAVSLIPLAVYGFEKWSGWWSFEATPGHYRLFYSWINGEWFLMELCTIIGSSIALYWYRFPFLTTPLFVVLWFMSMDATSIFVAPENLFNALQWVSIFLGLALLAIAFFIDCKSKGDFAFWSYLFGTFIFWIGLSLLDTHSEFWRAIYCVINVIMMLLSVILQRRVLLIFGALGVFGYVMSLFYRYFANSIFFPFILSGLGVAIVFLGIWYKHHHKEIEEKLLNALPISRARRHR